MEQHFRAPCPGVSKSRYFARSMAIKYSNFSRFYKKKGPFYKKIPFLELLETPNIRCPVVGLVGGCGARAVSHKTPIYFIHSHNFLSFQCLFDSRSCCQKTKVTRFIITYIRQATLQFRNKSLDVDGASKSSTSSTTRFSHNKGRSKSTGTRSDKVGLNSVY